METGKKAEAEISKARRQMEIESAIDMEWNEEDISRVTAYTSAALTSERQKLEELLAKHNLQKDLYHKTLQDNQDLKHSNEALKVIQLISCPAPNGRLTSHSSLGLQGRATGSKSSNLGVE